MKLKTCHVDQTFQHFRMSHQSECDPSQRFSSTRIEQVYNLNRAIISE